MAMDFENGGVYVAHRVRSGTTANGPWKLVVIKETSGKGKGELTLFLKDPDTDISEGQQFIVKEMGKYVRKMGRTAQGGWRMKENFENVTIEPYEFQPIGKVTIDDISTEDLGDLDIFK